MGPYKNHKINDTYMKEHFILALHGIHVTRVFRKMFYILVLCFLHFTLAQILSLSYFGLQFYWSPWVKYNRKSMLWLCHSVYMLHITFLPISQKSMKFQHFSLLVYSHRAQQHWFTITYILCTSDFGVLFHYDPLIIIPW